MAMDGDEGWDVVDVLSEQLDIARQTVANTVRLLEEENTVPFIARYRQAETNRLPVEGIRAIKHQLDQLRRVQTKASSVIKTIEKSGKLFPALQEAIKHAQTLEEVEDLYEPYKANSKRSLAERARSLGLECLAHNLLNSSSPLQLQAAVKPATKGVSTLKEVEQGVQNLVADIIAKNKYLLDKMKTLCRFGITIQTTKSAGTKKLEKDTTSKNEDKSQKFELYFDFTIPLKRIQPHQVLAINRGEKAKILSVKVQFDERIKRDYTTFCQQKWHFAFNGSNQRLFGACLEDAFNRLLVPLMTRRIRAELKKKAEEASLEVFASNLRRLLLAAPVRGRVVLGLDPGFRHGCKFAVTNEAGYVLEVGLLHLVTRPDLGKKEKARLISLLDKHSCRTVALGNGTACRETEMVLTEVIKSTVIQHLAVQYCIVSECGASVYSASPVAEEELSDMDVSLRGAVSIARRLQDPLAELVKIEPQHIGVGMYQHDMKETQLQLAVDGVVEECVSFVGVDVNVSSPLLLRRVAGLTEKMAKQIIAWRETNGAFRARSQLMQVKGLGPKSYLQCAGFLRILAHTSIYDTSEEPPNSGIGKKRKAAPVKSGHPAKRAKKSTASIAPNLFDATSIHPESYNMADKLISMAEADKEQLGQPDFICQIQTLHRAHDVESLARQLEVAEPTLQQVITCLMQPLNHDLRHELEKPLFRQGMTSMSDLKAGTRLTGRVTNTVMFGAFVDIGVGKDALIHKSNMAGRTPQLGDRVEVSVLQVDSNRGRIGLKLINIL